MIPWFSSFLTRSKVEAGDKPICSASWILVILALACRVCNIRQSIWSIFMVIFIAWLVMVKRKPQQAYQAIAF